MKKTWHRVLFNAVYAAVMLGIVFGAWALGAAKIDSQFVLPDISRTFSALGVAVRNPEFLSALGGTLLRSTVTFAIAFGLFSAAFYFATAYNGFRRIIEPIISALRTLPAVAVTLVLSIIIGGNGTPVVIGVLVIMPIMYSAARARTATVPIELKEVCKLCGAGKLATFRALWLPTLAGALPEMLSTAFSYNIKTVIGAEILAQTASSLGMYMNLAQQYLETATLIAAVFAAVVISVVAELVIRCVLALALRRFGD